MLDFSDLLWHCMPEFNQALSSILGFPLFHFTEHLFSCVRREKGAGEYLGANDTPFQKGKIILKSQTNLLLSLAKMYIFFIAVLFRGILRRNVMF